MKYYTIAPPPDLAAYVRFFWVLESDEPYCHRSLADGCAEMIFHYQGRFDELTDQGTIMPSFVSGLHGPSQKYRRFTTSGGFGIFGLYLYPFSLPLLFKLPASDLSDEMISLENLPGAEWKWLGHEILHASNNHERTHRLIDFLRSRIARTKLYDTPCLSVIQQMIHADTQLRVEQLASESFLSFRQFERKFKHLAGFSPKRYSRILRFQMATRSYGDREKSLTDIAYTCGYYDQSHFIHDFKQFSGYHPKQYFSGNPEGVAWREDYQ